MGAKPLSSSWMKGNSRAHVAKNAGKNTCREVEGWHQVYSYIGHSEVLGTNVHVEAHKKRCLQDEQLQKPSKSLAHRGPNMLTSG